MKNIKYRMRDAMRLAEEELSLAESNLADEAIKHMGKELNTQESWELKGRVEALRDVRKHVIDNDLPYYEWTG